ncbi:MAG TPA: glycosyltransferase [Candidatus Limnocylindria bacterium]|jgi:glycosyltransferase involved in cell wall biosynthesis|nr:glycosyltransferase [Candidatus Limnocylindria bacterium]
MEDFRQRPLKVIQLNSMLTGGGTDEQWLKLSMGLHATGHPLLGVGPGGREFTRRAETVKLPYYTTPREGPLKLRFILGAAKAIRALRADIVHGHHGRDYWPAILATRLSGVRPKLVLSRHLAKSPGSSLSKRHLLTCIDSLVCVSQFVLDVLRYGHRDPISPEAERHWRPPMRGDFSKVQVIYPGLDTERFHPLEGDTVATQRAEWGLGPNDYVFGVVGGYPKPRGKGQREFLKAAAIVKKAHPRARFAIVGRGDLESALRSDIEAFGLQGIAFLAPYSMDVPRVMNAIDCLVHPQIGTEAFPLVVGEAFACGRPVIASALDGIPEVFGVGGYGELVVPEDIEGLAEAMSNWVGRPPLSFAERQKLHQEVHEKAAVEIMVDAYAKLYRQLLSGAQTSETTIINR